MAGDLTFIHAADIHLDSPLHGLSRGDEAFSRLVRGATRKAFSNVVDLAIEEGAAFVVIAGDLYDGAWKDQSTGQFAIAQLARLTRAGIRSVIAFGNHDAESRVTRHLTAPEGVYKLKSAKCESVRFDDLGVVVHGRSYKEAATTENIASTYCPPEPGMLNVALLHTALDGHEGHANYAPCSLGELQAAGHDYWALGHVHDHVVRSDYAINPLLDLDADCILDVEATPARFAAEVAATRTLVSRAGTRLGIEPASLSADKAYGSGRLLGWLIDRNITPYIPVIDRTRQRDAFFTRDAFRYDREADAYRCPADKLLGYCGTNRTKQVRVYRSRPADCAACELKPQCTVGPKRGVTRLVSEDARDTVRALAGTDAYVPARRRRQRIERVFGHLKRNLGLRTLKLRGLSGAAEEFTMAAAAYNLQLLARQAAPA